ncbi:MAG: Gfo/Idh/MocA family oxidoreductase [Chloroflexota bacterium]
MNLSVGIIGAGKITAFFHLPILKTFSDVRIAYVADVRDPKILAQSHGVHAVLIGESVDILPSCDIVLLAIPVAVREPYIREFSRRGSYIFSEKPFAINRKPA